MAAHEPLKRSVAAEFASVTAGGPLGKRAKKGAKMSQLIEREIRRLEVLQQQTDGSKLSDSVSLPDDLAAIAAAVANEYSPIPRLVEDEAETNEEESEPVVALPADSPPPFPPPYDVTAETRMSIRFFDLQYLDAKAFQREVNGVVIGQYKLVCPFRCDSHPDHAVVEGFYPDAKKGKQFRVKNFANHLKAYHKSHYDFFLEHGADESVAPLAVLKLVDARRSAGLAELGTPRPARAGPMEKCLNGMKALRDKDAAILRVKQLLFFVENNVAFCASENPFCRLYIDAVSSLPPSSSAASLPSPSSAASVCSSASALSATSLPLAFGAVRAVQLAEFKEAKAFSIGFDLWSTKGLKHAFIALSVHWVSVSFLPREAVLDVIHIDSSHSAFQIARLIAARIDVWIEEGQFLYGDVTDNAKNVRIAAERLVEIFHRPHCRAHTNEAHAVDEAAVPTPDLTTFLDLTEERGDDGPVAAGTVTDANEEEKGAFLSASVGCAAHVGSLCVQDMLKSTPGVGTAVEVILKILRAIHLSNKKQRALRSIFVRRKKKPLCVILPCVTRWNSLYYALERFLEIKTEIEILAKSGLLNDTNSTVTVEDALQDRTVKALPSPIQIATVVLLMQQLKVMEEATVFVQGSDFYTLPFVPHFVSVIKESCAHNRAFDSPTSIQIKDSLLRSVTKRFEAFAQPNHPCVLAAALHPCTASRLRGYVADPKLVWKELKKLAVRIATATADEPALSSEQKELLENSGLEHASMKEVCEREVDLLATRLMLNPVKFDAATIKSNQDVVVAFYTTKNFDPCVLNMVKAVFSMPATSSTTERVFSTSGLVCSRVKSNLSPATIEMLTVVRFFIQRASPVQRQQLLDKLEKEISYSTAYVFI